MNLKNRVSLSFDRGTVLLDIPVHFDHQSLFSPLKLAYDRRVSRYRCDAFHYADLIRILDQKQIPYENTIPRWCSVSPSKNTLPGLRPEQKAAVEAWMTDKRGCIIMPTGSGKTVVALKIFEMLGISTLVVAPVRDLMYQWHQRIYSHFGIDAGIIGDNTFDLRPVSCTTYHSAFIHMDKLGDKFGLIVFDECHHLPGVSRREAALMSAAPYRIGLTATMERSDSLEKDLPSLIGPVQYRISIGALEGSALSEYDIFRIPVALNEPEQAGYNKATATIRAYIMTRLEELKQQGLPAKYTWQDLVTESGKDPEARKAQQAYYLKQSIEDRASEKIRVLEDLMRLHAGQPVIIFAGSNVMARELSLRFLIPCILSHSKKRERRLYLDGLTSGRFHALVANQVLDEGIDIPVVKVAVVLGGESSSRQAKQRLGRILRKSGTSRGILYEVVCRDTGEVKRSRKRRRSDAYQRTRHRKI